MSEDETALKPKRRPRYKGRFPRKFEEKYKEQNPDQYSSDVEKIKARGATPAGSHRPICVDEIMGVLMPQPGESGLDATLGFGGHAAALIKAIQPNGKLFAVDQDPIERPKTLQRFRDLGFSEDILVVGPLNYRQAQKFLREQGHPKVDFVLADLGLSSMQIDDPTRGFSVKSDAMLDLRMNPEVGAPAYEVLGRLSEAELIQILEENSDEPRARQIAAGLVRRRPKTIPEFVETVRSVVAGFSKRVQNDEGDLPVRRAIQALRILVNDEFSALDEFLEFLPEILNPRGRVAILSFHSGEDRRVKKSFQGFFRQGIYTRISDEAIRPSKEEQFSNPRSRSAKLRWAKK